MKMPVINSPAPAFNLPDQDGVTHTLAEYKGRWVLLYFYPKDDTPGCTIEACTIRDQFKDFKDIGVEVIGVSTDNIASHKKFASAYELPFTLLADVNKKMVEVYGVSSYMGTRRSSFLIDPNGNIAKVYEKVKPEAHATEVIADLKVFTQ